MVNSKQATISTRKILGSGEGKSSEAKAGRLLKRASRAYFMASLESESAASIWLRWWRRCVR
jgi:hypothetical protein